MAQSVDPNKVIQKLAVHIANEIIQKAANEVALDDAAALIAQYESKSGGNETPAGSDAD